MNGLLRISALVLISSLALAACASKGDLDRTTATAVEGKAEASQALQTAQQALQLAQKAEQDAHSADEQARVADQRAQKLYDRSLHK